MTERRVGVLGAASMVGESLLPLLVRADWQVSAFSRRAFNRVGDDVVWRQINPSTSHLALPLAEEAHIPHWICVAPIWTFPNYLSLLEGSGARRVVVLSSTSRFSKQKSRDPAERALAQRLEDSEAELCAWAKGRGVEWTILRPTLIYGRGHDRNISEIARLIRRFGFFPLFGQGLGLRQPVHVADVAAACVAALNTATANNREYNLSGAETLPYREMVSRVFAALGRPPRFLIVPLGLFKLALVGLRLLPRYRHWSVAMVERMNQDLVFEHIDAARDLGFKPRLFQVLTEDVAERY